MREIERLFIEAKRSVVRTTARIPTWLIVLLVVLGWNEFVTIFTSPMYLFMVLFVGAVSFVVHQLGMTQVVLTVAQNTGRVAMRTVSVAVAELSDALKASASGEATVTPPRSPRRDDQATPRDTFQTPREESKKSL